MVMFTLGFTPLLPGKITCKLPVILNVTVSEIVVTVPCNTPLRTLLLNSGVANAAPPKLKTMALSLFTPSLKPVMPTACPPNAGGH